MRAGIETLQILEAMSSGDTDQERVGGMRVLAAWSRELRGIGELRGSASRESWAAFVSLVVFCGARVCITPKSQVESRTTSPKLAQQSAKDKPPGGGKWCRHQEDR